MNRTPATPLAAAKDRLMRLLNRREHSRAELDRKLRKKGFSSELSRQALDWAEEYGYLDDSRFAAAYAEELQRKGYGPLVLRKKLWERGIRDWEPEDTPPQARARAAEVVQKRYGPPDELEGETLMKAARFLARRGFLNETVREVLGPIPSH